MKLNFTNKSYADLKAELVANLILQSTDKKGNLVFKPLGIKKRGVRRDVHQFFVDSTDVHAEEFIVIEGNREGLYDTLPEGLFHQPLNPKSFKEKDEIIEEIKLHRKEEKSARKFFQPFDNQFFSTRMLVEQVEHNSLLGYADLHEFRAFDEFWNLGSFLTKNQKAILLKMFPLMHRKRGNMNFICMLIAMLTGLPVSVETKKRWEKISSGQKEMALGNCTLNADSIIGSTARNYVMHHTLTVECKNWQQLQQIISGRNLKEVIVFVLDALLNINHVYALNPVCENEKERFRISDAKEVSYLGYNCVI